MEYLYLFNHRFKVKKKINLKNYYCLKIIMKWLTKGAKLKKSAVLTEDEISDIFEKLDNNDPGHLLAKIGIVLIYYCLLRCKEALFFKLRISFKSKVWSYPNLTILFSKYLHQLWLNGSLQYIQFWYVIEKVGKVKDLGKFLK